MTEGAFMVAEARPEGILFRPMVTLPVEIYSLERKAEFLLNNAVTAEDYHRAMDQVRQLGLDPETVPHERPEGI
ncbi:MAG: AbrB/MazE/SpoVT family DNA-binding domain-containing protein [Bacillota bacterium]